MTFHALDSQTPGGVYLCQVSETVSCGACCGLYNVPDPSRPGLQRLLALRTERFDRVSRTVDAITQFESETRADEPSERPLPEFHHCAFIGLIGENRSRVGCLLHPLADGNKGLDFRGLSHYGGMACNGYFCPGCREMPARIKQCVRAVADDWHLYGMVVTEGRLLTELAAAVEARAGMEISPERMPPGSAAAAAFLGLLRLKLDWPFRSNSALAVHYYFNDGLYARPKVDPARVGLPPSPWAPSLSELGSDLRTANEFRAAEARVSAAVEALAAELRRANGK
jgi:hypothetical protein